MVKNKCELSTQPVNMSGAIDYAFHSVLWDLLDWATLVRLASTCQRLAGLLRADHRAPFLDQVFAIPRCYVGGKLLSPFPIVGATAILEDIGQSLDYQVRLRFRFTQSSFVNLLHRIWASYPQTIHLPEEAFGRATFSLTEEASVWRWHHLWTEANTKEWWWKPSETYPKIRLGDTVVLGMAVLMIFAHCGLSLSLIGIRHPSTGQVWINNESMAPVRHLCALMRLKLE